MREYRPCHSRKKRAKLDDKKSVGRKDDHTRTLRNHYPYTSHRPSTPLVRDVKDAVVQFNDIGREIGSTSESGSSSCCTLMQQTTNLPPPQSLRKRILQKSLALAEDNGLETKFRAATKCNKMTGRMKRQKQGSGVGYTSMSFSPACVLSAL